MIDRDAEIELLKQKLADAQDFIKSVAQTEDHLVPLPNGDLHRGFRHKNAAANIDVDVIPESMGNPLDRAMANILKAAGQGGGHGLTCLWCGLQWPQTSAKEVREHLKDAHPSVVTGWESMNADALAFNLAEANARLEAANA